MRLFSRDSFMRHFLSGFAIGAAGLMAIQAASADDQQPRAVEPAVARAAH